MSELQRVKEKLIEDHARLRGKTAVLEDLALQILRGDDELVSALRLKCVDIQAHLLRHMGWEESRVLPVLQGLPDQGPSREAASILVHEHDSQRRRVEELLTTPGDASWPPSQLARHILEFVRWLERDMVSEETRLLAILGENPDLPLDGAGGDSPSPDHSSSRGR